MEPDIGGALVGGALVSGALVGGGCGSGLGIDSLSLVGDEGHHKHGVLAGWKPPGPHPHTLAGTGCGSGTGIIHLPGVLTGHPPHGGSQPHSDFCV